MGVVMDFLLPSWACQQLRHIALTAPAACACLFKLDPGTCYTSLKPWRMNGSEALPRKVVDFAHRTAAPLGL
ncbi:MAG TPA: hypothetical protein VF146_12185 [Bryobacteraceae bacterium]